MFAFYLYVYLCACEHHIHAHCSNEFKYTEQSSRNIRQETENDTEQVTDIHLGHCFVDTHRHTQAYFQNGESIYN